MQMFRMIGKIFARKSALRAVTSTAVFCTVFCGGAYLMGVQVPPFKWMWSFQSNGTGANAARPEQPTGVSSLSEDDPVRNFAKTGVGQVLFTAMSSDNCRRSLFDNRTGATYEVGEIFCGQKPENTNSERLQSMGKPFRK